MPPRWRADVTACGADGQLDLEVVDGVGVVTLVNPKRHNALSNQTFRFDLPDLLGQLDQRDDVRVIVVTGAGGAFCAGTELDADGFGDASYDDTLALLRDAHRSVSLLRDGSTPSIAAVAGVAVGAGFGLAAACDLRIAAPAARFIVPYARMGLTPDMGLSFLLAEQLGQALALDLVLSGRTLGAEEARAAGLISRVDDDPRATAVELARTIAAYPAAAVRGAPAAGLTGTLNEAEPRAFADQLHSAEFHKIFAAYLASLRRPAGS
jgi:enoyl-CoA hydratase/carnithine racemase